MLNKVGFTQSHYMFKPYNHNQACLQKNMQGKYNYTERDLSHTDIIMQCVTVYM